MDVGLNLDSWNVGSLDPALSDGDVGGLSVSLGLGCDNVS